MHKRVALSSEYQLLPILPVREEGRKEVRLPQPMPRRG